MKKQVGAAAVEFALVCIFVLALLLGMVEIGRALFKANSAVEATRRGARTAALVAVGERSTVLNEMRAAMPDLEDGQMRIEYSSDGVNFQASCPANCLLVRVSLQDYSFTPLVSFLPASIPFPGFHTSLPRETLGAP